MSDNSPTVRKLTRLLKDVLTANKKATITIDIVPGKGPFISITKRPDITELPEE